MDQKDLHDGYYVDARDPGRGWRLWSDSFPTKKMAEGRIALAQKAYPEHEFKTRPALSFHGAVFQKGRSAINQPRDTNPHTPGHIYHEWWNAGWVAANNEQQAG